MNTPGKRLKGLASCWFGLQRVSHHQIKES